MTKEKEVELMYEDEHENCHLYVKNEEKAAIQYVNSGNEELDYEEESTSGIHLIIVTKGSCNVAMGMYNRVLKAGEMTCLAPVLANVINLFMPKESEAFIFRLKRLNFCSSFPIENLYSAIPDLRKHFSGSPITLKVHERIGQMLKLLYLSMEDELRCTTFFDLKEQELLYYLRAYYSKQDLLMFFAPVANSDADFADHIYANIDKIKTVVDVANFTGYSISGVKKKYIKVFGMPFSEWIAREKAQLVYRAISCSRKTFKEIANEVGFSSSSHLDTFCKKHFGMSPGSLRRKASRENMELMINLRSEKR